jgi:ribonuclease VapC
MGRKRIAEVIVVDSSALVAILFAEPEREAYIETILASKRALVSSASKVETKIVVHGRRGQRGVLMLDDLLRAAPFEIVGHDDEQAEIAYAAFVAYGRGSGHPANLNFGDLFSYALAKKLGLPLLFKGADFASTDIEPAARPRI